MPEILQFAEYFILFISEIFHFNGFLMFFAIKMSNKKPKYKSHFQEAWVYQVVEQRQEW